MKCPWCGRETGELSIAEIDFGDKNNRTRRPIIKYSHGCCKGPLISMLG
jgi:hypothetical protein